MKQELLERLEKGRSETIKYRSFFKKRDFCGSFKRWKVKSCIKFAIVAAIVLYNVLDMVFFMIGIILDGFEVGGTEAARNIFQNIFLGCFITGTVACGILSKVFANQMVKKSLKYDQEDREKGYTAAVNRIIPDVPNAYRNPKMLNRLIRMIQQGKANTVEEAVYVNEKRIKEDKGIVSFLACCAMFGVFNYLNNRE